MRNKRGGMGREREKERVEKRGNNRIRRGRKKWGRGRRFVAKGVWRTQMILEKQRENNRLINKIASPSESSPIGNTMCWRRHEWKKREMKIMTWNESNNLDEAEAA